MHQATTTSWMMLNREISGWQERALKAEAECERLREVLALAVEWDCCDSEGVPAVWLEDAEALLNARR